MNDKDLITDYLIDTQDPVTLDDFLRQRCPNALVQGRGTSDGIVYREGYPVVRVFGDAAQFRLVMRVNYYPMVKEIPLDEQGQPSIDVGPLERRHPEIYGEEAKLREEQRREQAFYRQENAAFCQRVQDWMVRDQMAWRHGGWISASERLRLMVWRLSSMNTKVWIGICMCATCSLLGAVEPNTHF
jgi:hypothetical protein